MKKDQWEKWFALEPKAAQIATTKKLSWIVCSAILE